MKGAQLQSHMAFCRQPTFKLGLPVCRIELVHKQCTPAFKLSISGQKAAPAASSPP